VLKSTRYPRQLAKVPQAQKLSANRHINCCPFMPLQCCLLIAVRLSHIGILHGNGEAEMAFREWLQKQSPAYTATLFSDLYQDWTGASVCHVSYPLLMSRYTLSLLSCP
jgi:hypothetical protein